jgi:hypothetical protein
MRFDNKEKEMRYLKEFNEYILEKSDPKVGTGKKPKGSSRRLYTDENPKDTVSVKFRTLEDIRATINSSSFKSKSHKRQSQILNLIEQRVRVAHVRAKDPETKSRLKRAGDYIKTKCEKSKEKTKRLNESFDDSDTMARYQLFEAVTTMAFHFNSEYITDEESIKDLIEKYNESYVSGKSWSGGPPPKAFIEYFNKNHSKKGSASMKTFYPTIDLMIHTPDYGTLIVGFSIIDKSYKLFNWSSLTDSNNSSPDYDKAVLSEITKIVKNEINKMSLDQVIDTFQLNVKNKIEWEWKS